MEINVQAAIGAGLDTFAQRRPEIASRLKLFEVDRPDPQAWKRQRLIELGFGIPEWLPLELLEPEDRPGYQMAEKGARASGTPFISFFAPPEMLALAHEAGFREARHVSAADLARRYLAGRTDNLRSSSGEDFLVATA